MSWCNETIQRILEMDIQRNNYKTREELMSAVDAIIYREIFENLDDTLYGINRYWKSYGTWRIQLWVNVYHFGREIGARLNRLFITTHDEDRVFELTDFDEAICEAIQSWAFVYWSCELWKNEE